MFHCFMVGIKSGSLVASSECKSLSESSAMSCDISFDVSGLSL